MSKIHDLWGIFFSHLIQEAHFDVLKHVWGKERIMIFPLLALPCRYLNCIADTKYLCCFFSTSSSKSSDVSPREVKLPSGRVMRLRHLQVCSCAENQTSFSWLPGYCINCSTAIKSSITNTTDLLLPNINIRLKKEKSNRFCNKILYYINMHANIHRARKTEGHHRRASKKWLESLLRFLMESFVV